MSPSNHGSTARQCHFVQDDDQKTNEKHRTDIHEYRYSCMPVSVLFIIACECGEKGIVHHSAQETATANVVHLTFVQKDHLIKLIWREWWLTIYQHRVRPDVAVRFIDGQNPVDDSSGDTQSRCQCDHRDYHDRRYDRRFGEVWYRNQPISDSPHFFCCQLSFPCIELIIICHGSMVPWRLSLTKRLDSAEQKKQCGLALLVTDDARFLTLYSFDLFNVHLIHYPPGKSQRVYSCYTEPFIARPVQQNCDDVYWFVWSIAASDITHVFIA